MRAFFICCVTLWCLQSISVGSLRDRTRRNSILETMRFESHFKSYFGNAKAFNIKKIKIIAEPVAAMAGGGLRLGGDGRQVS